MTPTGCAIDPVTDKLFVLTVAVTMVANGKLSAGAVLLLSTREIGELPLVVWLALNDRARGARAEQPAANVPGKIATCLQFSAVSSALFPGSYTGAWLAVDAGAGVFAAVTYWKRAARNRTPSAMSTCVHVAIRRRKSCGTARPDALAGGWHVVC